MKFSVVIPAFNAEKLISRAIKSVLSQSYHAIEIIVVDDGSDDNTCEVALSCSKLVRCLHQDNAGPSKARNYGIRDAKGDYIAFLDADDEWYPHHLKQAYEIFILYPLVNWYSSPYIKKDDTGRLIGSNYSGGLRGCTLIENYFSVQTKYKFISTITTIIRRTTLLELGGFNEKMRYGGDKELWFRMGLSYPKLGFSHKVGAIYWQNQDSITHTIDKSNRDRFNYLLRLEQLAGSEGADAVRLSKPYVLDFTQKLIVYSILGHDSSVLVDIKKRYGSKINLFHRILLALGLSTSKSILVLCAQLKRIMRDIL